MDHLDFKELRARMALTQAGLANYLGISRKTVVEIEAARAPIEERTAFAIRALSHRIRVLENTFWVTKSIRDTWIVVRRTAREMRSERAMFYMQSDTMLYGEFKRRTDAYRWCAALRLANNPRNTQKLIRQRNAELRGLNS